MDLKKNLLNVAQQLNVAKKLIAYDCNKDFKINEKYSFIYSSIIYWLKNPKKSILKVSNLLKKDGIFMFTIPNQNYFKYCKSYSKSGKFWNLINRGRKNTLQSTIVEQEFEKWLKRSNFDIVNKHKLLSEKTLNVWDFGLRPISPYLIKLTNIISSKTRFEVKKDWCNNLYPIVENMVLQELAEGPKNGGYCIYLIKKR